MLLCYKVAAGLAAGCTIVAKPAPETPMDAYILAECIEAAGLPPGVFNVIPAGRETGDYLIRHPGHRQDQLHRQHRRRDARSPQSAAERFTRMSFELGGKSAAIVLDDADVGHVLASLVPYSMPITGQVCFSLTRVLVPERRKDELLDAYVGAVKTSRSAIRTIPRRRWGRSPWSGSSSACRATSARATPKARSSCSAAAGRTTSTRGYFVEPTVFADVESSMTIAQEEIFGPVVSFITYNDVDDAVAKANDTMYGLHGAVYTRGPRARLRGRAARALGQRDRERHDRRSKMPFGGFKQSGLGREGGIEGLEPYFELKTVYFA